MTYCHKVALYFLVNRLARYLFSCSVHSYSDAEEKQIVLEATRLLMSSYGRTKKESRETADKNSLRYKRKPDANQKIFKRRSDVSLDRQAVKEKQLLAAEQKVKYCSADEVTVKL